MNFLASISKIGEKGGLEAKLHTILLGHGRRCDYTRSVNLFPDGVIRLRTFQVNTATAMQLAGLIMVIVVASARAQGVDLADRPVAQVRIEGLVEVPKQLVFNQIRLIQGSPYHAQKVQQDIVRITHLGRFASVQAVVEPQEDGAVTVTYVVKEQPLVAKVEIKGNKTLTDQELLPLVLLRSGDPADPFLIDRAIKQMEQAYRKAGYFATHISYDKTQLEESNQLVFRIREGIRVRIRQLQFKGNHAYRDKQLRSKIQSNTYVPILRPGILSRQQLDDDVSNLRDFYRDEGYLDVQVGRRIILAPDQRDAQIEFVIDEGRLYTVSDIRIEGNTLFSRDQLLETMAINIGDAFMAEHQRRSQQALINLYGKLGFIETTVEMNRLFHEAKPTVSLVVTITEGVPYLVGTIAVRGNQLTQDKVIYRQIRGMKPGHRFDRSGIKLTEQLLSQSSLFSEGKVTILGETNQTHRDVLIEVKEANTGSLSFGAGISSDAGLIGSVDLVQRNFDIADLPASAGEFFTGRALRGAGQYFALSLQPGNEQSRYSVNFSEPAIFESDFSFNTHLFFFEREREDWDEKRLGATLGFGHRFGDVWSVSMRLRAEEIEIKEIEIDAPIDVFEVQDDSLITSIGFSLSRNTTDNRLFPTRGNRLQMGISQAGAMGGDYDFTQMDFSWRQYWTVDEDFFGRRTVFSVKLELGYLFDEDEAPIFERLYAGGHRTFRGFQFRGIGPRGIRQNTLTKGDDPVGGDWSFLLGLEYNFPIYQQVVRGVLFADTGTVQDDLGLDQYRVSMGFGLRLKIPFLGQAPFALDFAVPIVKEDDDETQTVSFDLALPF